MHKSLEQKINEDLQKTGYPTEIVSASVMQQRGWGVTHNPSYWDDTEGKSREFDIMAFHAMAVQETRIHKMTVGIYLISECKKSEKPWVFFMTKENHTSSNVIDYIKYIGINGSTRDRQNSTPSASLKPYNEKLREFHHYSRKDYLARTFYEALKGQDKSNHSTTIYSAIMSSIKATLYLRDLYKDFNDVLFIFYPVIIFNGNIFEAYVSSDKSTKLIPSKHVQLSFRYIFGRSSFVSEKYSNQQKFIIDIIHEEYINDFLELIEGEQEQFSQMLLF